MEKPVFIGLYTRYSSWTVRVETVLKYFDIPHEAQMWNVFNDETEQPPAPFRGGLFPVLQPKPKSDPSFLIHDSLAICEYLAETNPELELWPQDEKLRALARSAVAVMHSGFTGLRNTFACNFLAKFTGDIEISDEIVKECRKMVDLWSSCRATTIQRLSALGQTDQGFLFGKFTIADAFFWPVLWRFRSYGLPATGISDEGLKWMKTMWSDPKMRLLQASYFEQALNPDTVMPNYDNIFPGTSVKMGSFPENWTFTC
ncbi:Hypothetical protein R9X50_00283600 [Acrodontium crateriforme]|uniref:GST N-terminal domain-containing protein n=1 Tax=Acrodontium crateriforme TaxID=150365 RepID=A0AAQ3RBB8_9PEZI|nr:Hypothetical protein R9X50_00283600 [Acrodontium crateriforme]